MWSRLLYQDLISSSQLKTTFPKRLKLEDISWEYFVFYPKCHSGFYMNQKRIEVNFSLLLSGSFFSYLIALDA